MVVFKDEKKKKDILQKDRERIYNCKVFVVFFLKEMLLRKGRSRVYREVSAGTDSKSF